VLSAHSTSSTMLRLYKHVSLALRPGSQDSASAMFATRKTDLFLVIVSMSWDSWVIGLARWRWWGFV
jgi:hypothetical protein